MSQSILSYHLSIHAIFRAEIGLNDFKWHVVWTILQWCTGTDWDVSCHMVSHVMCVTLTATVGAWSQIGRGPRTQDHIFGAKYEKYVKHYKLLLTVHVSWKNIRLLLPQWNETWWIANKILYSILEKSYIIWITNIISNIVTF